MPAGTPELVPKDGLTTRQRRQRPLLIVHTGDGKGKSTAAFGLALRGWNQGWSVGIFQFVKSARWRIGEQAAFESLGELHDTAGRGGSIEWHKMLDEFTYPINWGWVDIDDVIDTLTTRSGYQHVIITGRRADAKLVAAAQLVTEMTKIKHPFDDGQKGQRGIEW